MSSPDFSGIAQSMFAYGTDLDVVQRWIDSVQSSDATALDAPDGSESSDFGDTSEVSLSKTPRLRHSTMSKGSPIDDTMSRDMKFRNAPIDPSEVEKKTIQDLRWLERPPTFQPIKNSDLSLPSDVHHLHQEIHTAATKMERIIPYEVREAVEAQEGKLPDYHICDSKTDTNILVTLDNLLQILEDTDRHARRDNDAGLREVRARLLSMVLLDLSLSGRKLNKGEPWVMANPRGVVDGLVGLVGLAADELPWCRLKDDEESIAYGYSPSTNSSALTTHQTEDLGVQEVLCPIPDKLTKLGKAITYFHVRELRWRDELSRYTHENGNPFAVSVASKCNSITTDPLTRLVIWVAAWHKYMRRVRFDVGLSKLPEGLPTNDEDNDVPQEEPTARCELVTVPLITIDGHKWEIYYARDEGSTIGIYGPENLGSTETLVGLYALVASLEALHRWIANDFWHRMEEWYMCSEDGSDTGH
ncbi:hypothetical protein F5Y18DRAFT_437816 [Xylariaceae sp. FL1019]|nr:hypothetical protein F5Y18DRAFT_437816 [Xylariaceae sp. FL1019]